VGQPEGLADYGVESTKRVDVRPVPCLLAVKHVELMRVAEIFKHPRAVRIDQFGAETRPTRLPSRRLYRS
jgi:hypothetical protein